MQQPFSYLNSEALSSEEIEELRVDRDEALTDLSESIADNYHNVLLYGTRGVGKTFLVRLLETKLAREFPQIFPVFVRVGGLRMYNAGDEVAAFSRAVLLQVCVEIWKTVLGRGYLDLRETSAVEADVDPDGLEARTVKRVFRLLMTSEEVANTSYRFQQFGIHGENDSHHALRKRTSDVLPFEFAELVDELLDRVLHSAGKTRIVALCDEANLLPVFAQEEVLGRYFELFRSKKMQFLFVAGYRDWDRDRHVPLCFEKVFELKGFADFAAFTEFVNRAGHGTPFTEDALRCLFDESRGAPSVALDIGRQCWQRLQSAGDNRVPRSLVKECAAAYGKLLEEVRRESERENQE